MSTALLTDRYELTMLESALRDGTARRRCVFEVFARRLPDGRRFGVVAGTQRLLDAIQAFRFDEDALSFLRDQGVVDEATANYLAGFRFRGDVDGYPEGELYFPQSPILTVTGTFAEAVVPRVTLITRKAYGGAYIAMNSAALGATKVLAWPGAEVAVMGSVAAVRILHRRKLAEVGEALRPSLELELAAEHETIAGGLERAISLGVVNAIVSPAHSRSAIAETIAAAPQNRGAHGNIPL